MFDGWRSRESPFFLFSFLSFSDFLLCFSPFEIIIIIIIIINYALLIKCFFFPTLLWLSALVNSIRWTVALWRMADSSTPLQRNIHGTLPHHPCMLYWENGVVHSPGYVPLGQYPAVVATFRKGCRRCYNAMSLHLILCITCANFNFTVTASYIPDCTESIGDSLSRHGFATFRKFVQQT